MLPIAAWIPEKGDDSLITTVETFFIELGVKSNQVLIKDGIGAGFKGTYMFLKNRTGVLREFGFLSG